MTTASQVQPQIPAWWTDEEMQMEPKPLWGFYRIKREVHSASFLCPIEGNAQYRAVGWVSVMQLARHIESDYMDERQVQAAREAELQAEVSRVHRIYLRYYHIIVEQELELGKLKRELAEAMRECIDFTISYGIGDEDRYRARYKELTGKEFDE